MSASSRPQDAKGLTEAPTSVTDTTTPFQQDLTRYPIVAVASEANELGELEAADVEALARLAKLFQDYGVSSFFCVFKNESKEKKRRLIHRRQATWDGPNDPQDPHNWPSYRKVFTGVILSLGQLVTLMSASMIAAALGEIQHDLDISASTSQIIFSTYFLGMAFAPFLIAAWSETTGRKQVWLAANAWYILSNALCPVGNSKVLMIVGRFMTGAGASVGITVISLSLSLNLCQVNNGS